MSRRYKEHESALQAERDVAEYLKALGWFVLPAENYSKGGAPVIAGNGEKLVEPDIIGMRPLIPPPAPQQGTFLFADVEVLDLDRGTGGLRRGRSH